MDNNFEVKSEIFSGPIEILLSLVEKRKLFINEISLSKIADDYICFVNSLGYSTKEDISDFVYTATTLLLIKSKSLLPDFNITTEEQESIEELKKRLVIFKKIKQLGLYVSENIHSRSIFQKEFIRITTPVFSPSNDMTLDNIFLATKNILNILPKKEFQPKIKICKTITLEEMIINLRNRIKEGMKIAFSDFSDNTKKDKVNMVVSFLAMLELIKEGSICITQDKLFGKITIELNQVNTPKY